jgi:hypothetical protein
MKKWAVYSFMVFFADVVWANPVTLPTVSDGGRLVVFLSASAVEVSIVTLFLFCFDMALKPVWFVLFFGNMIIYYMLFLPLMEAIPNLLLVEGLIVAADGVLIKMVSLFDAFQQHTFRRLQWKYALLIAAVSNVVSYYLGLVMQG